LCYAVSMDKIDEGLKRISEFVGKLKINNAINR